LILVDTSIWIDHFRSGHDGLRELLAGGQVLGHPLVIGELAVGAFRDRSILADLDNLPRAIVAADDEARAFIEREVLFGQGLGYVDVHLLASVRLTPGATLWTGDRRLEAVARRLGVGA
jgi:hypothetical protein